MPTPNITVDQLVEDESFRAWTQGRAGTDEKKKWDRWVQQSTKNRRLARRAQQAITGFSFASSTSPHTSQAWERLQRGITGHSRSPLSCAFRCSTAPEIMDLLWGRGEHPCCYNGRPKWVVDAFIT